MSHPPPEFDDPQLKASVRRACTRPASTELRDRIAELVLRETAPARRIARPGGTLRWALAAAAAAAALILLALTAGPTLLRDFRESGEQRAELAANLPLFHEMVRAHRAPAPARPLPVTDRAALRASLSAELGRPVPVPDWRARGWHLASATMGPVGAHTAAHLRYENAGRTLLFLSLPATAYSEPGHEHGDHHDHAAGPEIYRFTVCNHAITGFVRDAGLHCTVGDRAATTAELAALKVD
jgi:hypothetical protein